MVQDDQSNHRKTSFLNEVFCWKHSSFVYFCENTMMNDMLKIEHFEVLDTTLECAINPNFECFLLVNKGKLNAVSKQFTLNEISDSILYIPSKTLDKISLSADQAEYWLLQFDKNFYSHFFFETYHYFDIKQVLSFEGFPCFAHLQHVFLMIEHEMSQDQPNNKIAESLVQSFFSIYLEELKKQSPFNELSSNYHLNKLIDLIEHYFRENLPLSFYTEKLVLGERQLNNITQEFFNQSLGNLLVNRKIIEAKRELKIGVKSISEIGFELGFNEKSYFSRVFKKMTGFSPTEFQKKYRSTT